MGQVTSADSVDEHLDERDGILEFNQEGVNLECVAEADPCAPVLGIGLDGRSHDSGGNRCLHSAEVTAERVSDVRWQSYGEEGAPPGPCTWSG